MLTHSEIEKWRIEEEGNDNDYKCLWSGPKMQMDGAKSTKKMTSRMSHLSRREWVWSRPLRAGPHPNLLGDGPCYAALQPLRLFQGQRQNQFIAICKSKSICKLRWCKNTRGRWFSDSGDCSTAAPKAQVRAYTSDVNLVFFRTEYLRRLLCSWVHQKFATNTVFSGTSNICQKCVNQCKPV